MPYSMITYLINDGHIFMPPVLIDWEHIVFGLSINLLKNYSCAEMLKFKLGMHQGCILIFCLLEPTRLPVLESGVHVKIVEAHAI